MTLPIPRLFVYGIPGLYGGTRTKLHHQIIVWLKMCLEAHIIPNNTAYANEPLHSEIIGYLRAQFKPRTIDDYKFGAATLTDHRIDQIRKVAGFKKSVPIIEIKP